MVVWVAAVNVSYVNYDSLGCGNTSALAYVNTQNANPRSNSITSQSNFVNTSIPARYSFAVQDSASIPNGGAPLL